MQRYADDGRRYWERHAENYDRSYGLLGRPFPRVLARVAEATVGLGSVLEVAAGTGWVTPTLARSADRVVATDYSAAMIGRLRAKIAEAGATNVECVEANLYALPFASGAFDAVVAANVLHLVPDLERALTSLSAAVRPGGVVIVPTFCHDETLLARITSRVLSVTGFPGQRRFSLASLRRAVLRAGLSVHRAEVMSGIFPIGYIEATRAP